MSTTRSTLLPVTLGGLACDSPGPFGVRALWAGDRAYKEGRDLVDDSSRRQRALFGVALTGQSVTLLITVLALAALIGLAVLSWLERVG